MLTAWFLVIGGLLLSMAVSDHFRKRLPFSASALYLVAGYLLGPECFGLLDLHLREDSKAIELMSEVAVLISLFAVGLRLRVPLSDSRWKVPLIMATVAMLCTIALMTGLGVWLGWSLPTSLLAAAILAPTDPVLASDVQVQDIEDKDRLRFSLTGEGGMNDGIAFPFVLLALGLSGQHELGSFALHWLSVTVLWSIAVGLAVGWVLGAGCSRLVVWLRREHETAFGMESFLTLGLIALTYGLALAAQSYGFLAVFVAGLAMRSVEQRAIGGRLERDPDPVNERVEPELEPAYMAKAVLDFSLDLEKLAELTVMIVIGSLLSPAAFTGTSLIVAVALIFVARSIAIFATTRTSRLGKAQRRLAAWFGIRGIGSMYYLAYAMAHGVSGREADMVADAVLVTIALSVLLHGSTSTPLMQRYRVLRQKTSKLGSR